MQDKVDSGASKEIAEDYASSLSDLRISTKPLITMLTMLAEENQDYASVIVDVIEKHLDETQYKLPSLYLIDSIVKNVGGEYKRLFSIKLGKMFTSAFKQVDEKIRKKMYELRQTWADIFPASRLYWLDTSVAALDPAWPVTAQLKTVSPQPNIHFNPNFQGSHAPDAFPPALSSSISHVPPPIRKDHKELIKIQAEKKLLEQKKQVVLDIIKEKEKKEDSQTPTTIFVAPWKLKQLKVSPTSAASSEDSPKILVTDKKGEKASKAQQDKTTILCKSFPHKKSPPLPIESADKHSKLKKDDSYKSSSHKKSANSKSSHKKSENSKSPHKKSENSKSSSHKETTSSKSSSHKRSHNKSRHRSASREKSSSSKSREKSSDKSHHRSKSREKSHKESKSHESKTSTKRSRSHDKFNKQSARHSQSRSPSRPSEKLSQSDDSTKASTKDSNKPPAFRNTVQVLRSKDSEEVTSSGIVQCLPTSVDRMEHPISRDSDKISTSIDSGNFPDSVDPEESLTLKESNKSSASATEERNGKMFSPQRTQSKTDNENNHNPPLIVKKPKEANLSPLNLENVSSMSDSLADIFSDSIAPEKSDAIVEESPKSCEKSLAQSNKETNMPSQHIMEELPASSKPEKEISSALQPIEALKDVDLRVILGTNFPGGTQKPSSTPVKDDTLSLFGKEDVDLRQMSFRPPYLPTSGIGAGPAAPSTVVVIPPVQTASTLAAPPILPMPTLAAPPILPTPTLAATQILPAPPIPPMLEFQDTAVDDDIIFVGSGAPVEKNTSFNGPPQPPISKEKDSFFQACLNQLNDDLHLGKISRFDYNRTVQDLHLAKDKNQLEEFQKRTQFLRMPEPVPTLQPPPLPPRFPSLPVTEATSSASFPPVVPPPMIDVQSLLAKLQTTGIIEEPSRPKAPQPKVVAVETTRVSLEHLKGVPSVEKMFESASLKKKNRCLIHHLYKGTQCSSCGLRIPADQKTMYSRHLDWHFRMNKKQQESTRKANIRKLFLSIDQWIQYEEIDQTQEPASTVFDMVPRNIAESQIEHEVTIEEEIPCVTANPDDPSSSQCPVCFETFSHFYDQNKEEWQYKNAIPMMGRNYHPGCWQDYERQQNDSTADIVTLSTENDKESEKHLREESNTEEASNSSLPPIISALLGTISRSGSPEILSSPQRSGSPEILPPPPKPVPETILVEDDSTDENTTADPPTPMKIPTKEPPKVTVKIERMSDDEEIEVHIHPRRPRILADIPLKIEIKDEPEDLPVSDELIDDDVTIWQNSTGDTAIDIDGNTQQPIAITDATASVPVIRLNVGKNSNLIARKSTPDDDVEEQGEPPIYDDPDFHPPPFTYDENRKPSFKGIKLNERPIDTIGYETSSFCSIM